MSRFESNSKCLLDSNAEVLSTGYIPLSVEEFSFERSLKLQVKLRNRWRSPLVEDCVGILENLFITETKKSN